MKLSVATLMLCLGTVNAKFLAGYIFSPGWRERLVRGSGSWPQGKAAVRANGLLQEEIPGQVYSCRKHSQGCTGLGGLEEPVAVLSQGG